MTYHKIVNETRATITHQVDTSDARTCCGCLAYHTGSALCRELRQDGTCQKRIDARARMMAVIASLINLAIVHHQETTVGPIVARLLGK